MREEIERARRAQQEHEQKHDVQLEMDYRSAAERQQAQMNSEIQWPEGTELCPVCKQPDNCGDCNHHPLTAEEVVELGGTFVLDNPS